MAKANVKKKIQFWGTGRRKKAIARVRLIPAGTGTITINDRTFEDYFPQSKIQRIEKRASHTNSQLKCLTERIRFFVLTKPSEVRRTGGTLNGTRQSQSEKDGARIKPF